MTQVEFRAYSEARHKDRERLSRTKGTAYAEPKDRFANFRRRALLMQMTPMQVAFCDLSKHFDRLMRFTQGAAQDTDGFESRIDDMIIYLQLIDGLHREEAQREHAKTVYRS